MAIKGFRGAELEISFYQSNDIYVTIFFERKIMVKNFLSSGIVILPKVLQSLNADLIVTKEIHAKLQKGYEAIKVGRVQDVAIAFARSREHC